MLKTQKENSKYLPPSNIINYYETNLTDEHNVFKHGVKYPERIMNSNKSATSIMFAANAVGYVMPPDVAYKAEYLWDTWMVGGQKGTRYNRSKSGSLT